MLENQSDNFDISKCYKQENQSDNSDNISDDELLKKIRQHLRQRSLTNAIKENNYLEDIVKHLRGIHPDWSTCEINKQARYLKNRADRYSW